MGESPTPVRHECACARRSSSARVLFRAARLDEAPIANCVGGPILLWICAKRGRSARQQLSRSRTEVGRADQEVSGQRREPEPRPASRLRSKAPRRASAARRCPQREDADAQLASVKAPSRGTVIMIGDGGETKLLSPPLPWGRCPTTMGGLGAEPLIRCVARRRRPAPGDAAWRRLEVDADTVADHGAPSG